VRNRGRLQTPRIISVAADVEHQLAQRAASLRDRVGQVRLADQVVAPAHRHGAGGESRLVQLDHGVEKLAQVIVVRVRPPKESDMQFLQ
jgi:hypothetical protein